MLWLYASLLGMGFGTAEIIVAGPYYFKAAVLYVAGVSSGGTYTAGASSGGTYTAGASAGQVTVE